jgi:hypothetical protein
MTRIPIANRPAPSKAYCMNTMLCLALLFSVFATGCETKQEKAERMGAKGLVRTQDGKWVPKGTRFFGSGHPWVMENGSPAPAVFDPTVFNQAMAQNYGTGGNAAQPVRAGPLCRCRHQRS